MWKDKPTGIKILWVWTIGTAVVLFSTVTRTRVRDMEKFINESDQQQQQQQQYKDGVSAEVDSGMIDGSSFPSGDNIIRDD
ncbi:uncharacterized protein LOC141646668 [Silene latifolia]|uniref:uncharacterized protein LOC141646668 n=1 Tax=Silene latifolia TaxID=37657 RepID=UPI003D775D93